MGQPAAKGGDSITGTDTHLVNTPDSPPPKPYQFAFEGTIDENISHNVFIMGMAAATIGSSTSEKSSTHIPLPPPAPGKFTKDPKNKAEIITGSSSVNINGRAAARNGDTANTCNDPVDLPNGTVNASGTVMIG
jgi:uncharacterized Zn-binding protein involved in type VI secretion